MSRGDVVMLLISLLLSEVDFVRELHLFCLHRFVACKDTGFGLWFNNRSIASSDAFSWLLDLILQSLSCGCLERAVLCTVSDVLAHNLFGFGDNLAMLLHV